MNKLSVVIPTLQKNIELLNNLITTLSKDECVEEIIVIDNSCKNLNATSDKVRVIIPDKNLFVNTSWNLGVREAKNEIVALLNDDITIPNDFCKNVLKQFPRRTGCIGVDIDYVKVTKEILPLPSLKELIFEEINERDLNWGICIFLKKSLYIDIPKELKIYCGDDWIIHQTKKQGKRVYQISGQEIYHYESLSSSETKFKDICKMDKKNYKKLTKSWWQNLLNISTSKKKYKITFCGIEITLNKTQI